MMMSVPSDIESVENVYASPHELPHHPTGSMANQNESIHTDIDSIRKYVSSVEGILRLCLIVSLTGAWISAASISRGRIDTSASRLQKNYIWHSFESYLQTRTACLVITILAVFVSLLDYGAHIGNINNNKNLRKMKFDWLSVIFDAIFLLAVFGVSVACTVRESQLRSNYDLYLVKLLFNIGAFAAAAAFGYIATILYIVLITLWIFDTFFPVDKEDTSMDDPRNRGSTRVEYTHRSPSNRQRSGNTATQSIPTPSTPPTINQSRTVVIERELSEEI